MVRSKRWLSCLFLLWLGSLLVGTPFGHCAYPSEEFKKGWQGFHHLLKNPGKAKYRSHWYAVKDRFQRAYKQSPQGSYAPKSLFYLGRVYDEMSRISRLKSDALQAVDYYKRVVLRFPKHSWADDALLRQAKVELYLLKDKDQAYVSLLSVVHKYPKGDMAPQAKALLDKLDKGRRTRAPAKPAGKSNKSKASPTAPPAVAKPAPASVRDQRAQLVHIRHWSSKDYTRVVLDLDHQVGFTKQLLKPDPHLKTPHRLLIDLEATRLDKDVPGKEGVADGILRSIRAARHSESTVRVVLDIDHIDHFRVFSLSNPFRVVIDVHGDKKGPSPTASSKKTIASKKAASSKKSASKAGDRADRVAVSKAAQGKNVARSLVEQLGLKIKTIMIDPGHGGKDPGAMANKLREKDINLKMARIIGNKLEQKGFRVLYTRVKDVFVPLEERTAMANAKDADLFISIHCNACPSKKAHGLEMYYLNLAKSRDAVRVAARENAVSMKKISDLQVILTDLMLSSKITESRDLAKDLQTRAFRKVRAKYKIKDRGVKGAPFYVLMGSKMPAVLAELGYLTHSGEAKKLRSTAYLESLADGMVEGVLAYKKRIEGVAGL